MSYNPNVPNPPPEPSPPRGDGGSNMLYFLVGGLVVLAGVFVFLYTNDYIGTRETNVNVEAPATGAAPSQEPAQPAPPPPAPATGGGTTTTQ